jgi:hypothetical protein
LIGVKRRPDRAHAATISANSGRLVTINATASPGPSPRDRSVRARRLALALSSAKLRSPSGDTIAGASGWTSAQCAAVIPTLAASS